MQARVDAAVVQILEEVKHHEDLYPMDQLFQRVNAEKGGGNGSNSNDIPLAVVHDVDEGENLVSEDVNK